MHWMLCLSTLLILVFVVWVENLQYRMKGFNSVWRFSTQTTLYRQCRHASLCLQWYIVNTEWTLYQQCQPDEYLCLCFESIVDLYWQCWLVDQQTPAFLSALSRTFRIPDEYLCLCFKSIVDLYRQCRLVDRQTPAFLSALSRTFRIPDEYLCLCFESIVDLYWQCWLVDQQTPAFLSALSRTFRIPDEYLCLCFESMVLMLYYWKHTHFDSVDTCCMQKIRSHPNSFHCICRHCWYIQSNYNVDSNTKTSNYSKVWFGALIYFRLEQTSN